MNNQKFLDVALYESSDAARLQELHPSTIRALCESVPGLFHAELALLPDGSLLDIMAYDSQASALAGIELERTLPEYVEFARHITKVIWTTRVLARSQAGTKS